MLKQKVVNISEITTLIEQLETLVEEDDYEILEFLGDLYCSGETVEQDTDKAIHYYKLAALGSERAKLLCELSEIEFNKIKSNLIQATLNKSNALQTQTQAQIPGSPS